LKPPLSRPLRAFKIVTFDHISSPALIRTFGAAAAFLTSRIGRRK
jgi:hypothetical protein